MVKSFDEELDLQGLLCPLPVLKAGKKLQALKPGQILKVLASDPMAAIDLPHYCQEQNHELLSSESEGEIFIFRIRRGFPKLEHRTIKWEPLPSITMLARVKGCDKTKK